MKYLRLTALLIMLISMAGAQSYAYDAEINYIYYNFYGDEATVTSKGLNTYLGSHWSIPSSVTYNGKTYRVTRIAPGAFNCSSGLGATSFNIPNSVTSIGDNALGDNWYNNQPDGLLYAGKVAYKYKGTMPDTIVIKDGTLGIAERAFYNRSSLTSIIIPESVISIGKEAFYGTTWYNNQPDGLVYAGKVAYKYKGTMPIGTSLVINEGTLGIAEYALSSGNLTSITIPNSVTSIGENAFQGCKKLTDFYCCGEVVPNAKSRAFSESSINTATLHVPPGSVESYMAVEPWNNFGTIVSVIFFADSKVKALCVANWDTDGDGDLNPEEAAAVTDLGTVFKDNTQINSFNELQYFTGLTRISANTFSGCRSLTSVAVPVGVTNIGNFAFNGCGGLTSVHITDLAAWCNISFGNSSSQPLSTAHHLYLNGHEITALIVPKSVTSIADYAFKGCTGLTSVSISSSVTKIGINAFNDCGGLATVYIPNSVTEIGNAAFYKCSSLTDVYCYAEEVPNTNTNAFSNSPIGSATLHVLDIAEDAYRKTAPWSGFGTIVTISPYISFADSLVKEICVANWDTNGDGEIVFEEAAAVPDLGTVFRGKGITSFNELQYFTGLTGISANAFYRCYSLTSVIIPENAGNIGNQAFQECGLTSITIPNSVTSIGNQAFRNCTNLTSITIPENVTSIGSSAFENCKLRNVMVKCATPPAGNKNFFSDQTFYHTTLYIPVGCWDAYAYDNYWYLFHNIKETVLTEEEVSIQQAYTLMDANTFAYSVYDPVNDCIGTIRSVSGIDENNPNHSWQVIDAGGEHYLYNIGAKKFAVATTNGSYTLSDEPTSINLKNGDNGIILGSQSNKQWALVSNESMCVEQSVITSVNSIPTASQTKGSYYDLEGRQLSTPQKGLNIIRYSNGTRKKVLMK